MSSPERLISVISHRYVHLPSFRGFSSTIHPNEKSQADVERAKTSLKSDWNEYLLQSSNSLSMKSLRVEVEAQSSILSSNKEEVIHETQSKVDCHQSFNNKVDQLHGKPAHTVYFGSVWDQRQLHSFDKMNTSSGRWSEKINSNQSSSDKSSMLLNETTQNKSLYESVKLCMM